MSGLPLRKTTRRVYSQLRVQITDWHAIKSLGVLAYFEAIKGRVRRVENQTSEVVSSLCLVFSDKTGDFFVRRRPRLNVTTVYANTAQIPGARSKKKRRSNHTK